MDLFDQLAKNSELHVPLAESLRPQSFDDFIGFENIKGCSPEFFELLNAGYLQNLILWGPPGTGKTTFAGLLKSKVQAEMVSLNAVNAGAKILRELGEEAKKRRIEYGRKTIVFIDEIHRFSKSQQDILLPYIERGEFFLIGATTENPGYELNAALLSRCRVLVFSRFSEEGFNRLTERVSQKFNISCANVVSVEALTFLFRRADGDGRRLLNFLEPIFALYKNKNTEISWPISVEVVAEISGHQVSYFDKAGDSHYDTVSAFIKSIRGSDPNAGLYYLARMLDGGEEPVFIARRLVILASEDIGNADPRALSLATSGLQAVELIGLPECAINLAQVVTYLASAPKSNRSYLGLQKAQEEVKRSGQLPIPLELRSANSKFARELGYGEGYQYSHEGARGYVAQEFFPEKVVQKDYYIPSEHGFEKNIRQYLAWLKNERSDNAKS